MKILSHSAYYTQFLSSFRWNIKKKAKILKPSLKQVEILHIDTEKGRKLYAAYELNAVERSNCQEILRHQFNSSCRKHKVLYISWAGDGGFALFLSSDAIGNSVLAAEDFLNNRYTLNMQTVMAITSGGGFSRNVRIKAQRGEVYVTGDSGIDSASPEN